MQNIENERLDFVDLFRSLGIILMIMGHVGFGAVFDKFIHAFHMPMFFFISGYFYNGSKSKSVLETVKKKALTLLVPYICFSTVHILVYFILNMKIDYSVLKTLAFNSEPTIPIAGALWFLTALFFTEIIYLCIDRSIKNNYLLHIVILTTVVIGVLFGKLISFRLPFSLDIAMVSIGYYHIAYKLKHTQKIDVFNLRIGVSIFGGFLVTISIFLNGYANIRLLSFSNFPLFYFNAVLSTVVGWNICRSVQHFVTTKRIRSIELIDSYLLSVGKNSIVYLCLNQIVILGIFRVFSWSGLKSSLYNPIILIMVMTVLWLCALIITNTRLRLFIGKIKR